MTLRERLQAELKSAMKARNSRRLSTLRLINAAIKDREIEARGEAPGQDVVVTDEAILAILGRMVRQREESVRAYEEGGRLELAEAEQAEIGVIQEFLPRQLDADEIDAAIRAAIAATGATTLRDMGKVMAALKARHGGQMNFGVVGPMVKDRLA